MSRWRPTTTFRTWREGGDRHAFAALLLLLAGVAAILLLHVVSREVSPASHYISEYGNRAWGWLLTASLVLIAGGMLALGALLRDGRQSRAPGPLTGPRLLQASAVMLIIAALLSTDRLGGEVEVATLAGKIHGVMSIGAFCLLVLAMVLFSPRFNDDFEALGRSSGFALPLALVAPAIAAAAFALMPDADGLRQRAFLAIVFGWLLATAFQVHSLRRGERGRS